MKQKRFHSIQTNIFLCMTTVTIIVIVLALLLYIMTSSSVFQRNYLQSSNQLAKILSSHVDNKIREIDELEVRLVENDIIRSELYAANDMLVLGENETVAPSLTLRKQIYSFTSYELGFYHLVVHLDNGLMIHFGQKYEISHRPALASDDASDQLAYDALITPIKNRHGSMYLTSLETPKVYDPLTDDPYAQPTITISRSIARVPLFEPQAVMEIHVSERMLKEAIDDTLLSFDTQATKVVIFDEKGGLVFPSALSAEEKSHYIQAQADKNIKNPSTNEKEIISKYQSDYTGWTLALITPNDVIDAGFRQYMATAIIIGVAAIGIILLISYGVAKNISSPIVKVQQTLSNLELDNLKVHNPSIVKTKYNELDMLQDALLFMRERLEKSIQDHIHLRSLSIQSRMVALQAQMNPHFLYNTLSIMAILAEENGDDEVCHMCHQLVHMLRYISSEADTTTFEKELEHARRYAQLIELRYGPKIQISYDIDPILLDVTMPPIILQPLVENCVKYARAGQEVLTVSVSARMEEGYWILQVQDNGPGFPEEALRLFEEKVRQENDLEKIIREGVSGIGLSNTYVRMKLSYGEGNFIFALSNRTQGACVTVGGRMKKEEQNA